MQKPEADDEDTNLDLFSTFPPLGDVDAEESPFSVRAVLVGTMLGSLVNASNVYLGASRNGNGTYKLSTEGVVQASRQASLPERPYSAPFSGTGS